MRNLPRLLLLATLVLGSLAILGDARAADSSKKAASKSKAAPVEPPAPPPGPALEEITVPQSEFAMPGEGGGKDPFFPDSTRLQPQKPAPKETNPAARPVPPPPPAPVRINGFAGTAANPLVILNNVTFGPGEEQTITAGTARVRLRCIEIRAAEQLVIVEVNGERRELKFGSAP